MDKALGALITTAVTVAIVGFLIFVAAGLATILIAFLGLFIAKASGGLKSYKNLGVAVIVAVSFSLACTGTLLAGSLFANVFMDWFFNTDSRFLQGAYGFEAAIASDAATFLKDILFAFAVLILATQIYVGIGRGAATLIFSIALLGANLSSLIVLRIFPFEMGLLWFPVDPSIWLQYHLQTWLTVVVSIFDFSNWFAAATDFVIRSAGNLFRFETLIGLIAGVWGLLGMVLREEKELGDVSDADIKELKKMLGGCVLVAGIACVILIIPMFEPNTFFAGVVVFLLGLAKILAAIAAFGAVIGFVLFSFGAMMAPKSE